MHIEAERGTVLLKLGSRFTELEAARMGEAVEAFAPFSQLVLDFSEVREFHDAAFFSLWKMLRAMAKVKVVLRGLTLHHSRLLRYLGFPDTRPLARA